MVLDTFCVGLRSRLVDANRAEKLDHDFVSRPRLGCKRSAARGESERRTRVRHDVAFACKSTHHAAHRDVRQPEARSDAPYARLNARVEEFRDHFAVVLRGLSFVLLTNRSVVLRG